MPGVPVRVLSLASPGLWALQTLRCWLPSEAVGPEDHLSLQPGGHLAMAGGSAGVHPQPRDPGPCPPCTLSQFPFCNHLIANIPVTIRSLRTHPPDPFLYPPGICGRRSLSYQSGGQEMPLGPGQMPEHQPHSQSILTSPKLSEERESVEKKLSSSLSNVLFEVPPRCLK